MHHEYGFTLVELSIVLVIIGLLVGGILVGRDMIRAAEIRATISQYEKYQSAVNTFRLKYGGIPGDITQAQATAFGLLPTSRTDYISLGSQSTVTHGNGLIEGHCQVNSCMLDLGYEQVLFWQDLSSANLIDGSFTQASDSYVSGKTSDFLPAARLGNSNYWFIYGINVEYNVSGGLEMVLPGNYFQLVGLGATVSSGSVPISNNLTPSQAYNIDTKIDDGNPVTGKVLATDIAGAGVIYAGWITDLGASHCATYKSFGGPISGYRTDAYADQYTCQLTLGARF